ncbi:MAG: histidine--tRNA ligase [bacterium]
MSNKPGTPKGTRDFLPEQMFRRHYAMDVMRTIFEKYGYEPLETPVMEKLNVLTGKYGEDGEKLIFRILRRGTGLEQLLQGKSEFIVNNYSDLVEEALRYDLTVPLSRVIAMHEKELIFPFKRYQIQPVWRADRPQKGRYREFYQCDIDAVGTDSVLADAEAIAVVYEVLQTLGFKKFKIRINNRKILNGILQYAGIAPDAGSGVLITIDKLDKIGFDGVKKELVRKGLSDDIIEKIFSIQKISGEPEQILGELTSRFSDIDILVQGAVELKQISQFLHELEIPSSNWIIDLFLARGLGYYTGPIYESIVEEPKIGSLCGGGRYDNLIGMFLGRDIPATGVSFGIERIIDVMTQLDMFPEAKTKTQVLVTLFDESTRGDCIRFTQQLRKAGVKTESFFKQAKMKKQFSYADKRGIPYVVIIGPDEAQEGKVTIKELATSKQVTLSSEQGLEYLLP